MRIYLSFFLLALAITHSSCTVGSKPAPRPKSVTFSYDALAAMQPRDIPTYVYVFPPLRSNKGGSPIEKLTAISSDSGSVMDWKTSSAMSMSLKKEIESQLSLGGYTIVSFGDLLTVNRPYSVLVVSTFYTLPYDVKSDSGEITDRANFVLIKGSLFDGNLDPKTKKDIIKVDGVTKIPAGMDFADPINKTMEQAYSWFADNSTGVILLE
jgi:hypothetical protein